jgi:hypothetical protein
MRAIARQAVGVQIRYQMSPRAIRWQIACVTFLE